MKSRNYPRRPFTSTNITKPLFPSLKNPFRKYKTLAPNRSPKKKKTKKMADKGISLDRIKAFWHSQVHDPEKWDANKVFFSFNCFFFDCLISVFFFSEFVILDLATVLVIELSCCWFLRASTVKFVFCISVKKLLYLTIVVPSGFRFVKRLCAVVYFIRWF